MISFWLWARSVDNWYLSGLYGANTPKLNATRHTGSEAKMATRRSAELSANAQNGRPFSEENSVQPSDRPGQNRR